MSGATPSFAPQDYDAQWASLGDFIRYNPGARHRRRLVLGAVASLALPSPTRVLDVGCGLGEIHLSLGRVLPDMRYTGVDLSPYAVEQCAERFPGATWAVLDVTCDVLEAEHDLVICSEVTEHIEDPTPALRNIGRMTAPGGYLVLTTPHGKVHATEKAVGHVAHPRRADLERWLDDAGFRVRQLRQWGWPAYTAMKYVGNMAPGAAVDHLANGTYGRGARAVNSLAYVGTLVGSLPQSRFGPQFVVVAERRS